MLREENNLKDEIANLKISVRDNPLPIYYNKTNKLVSALYMVTDIMDKEEPLRNKLRSLGTNIISDIYSSIDKRQSFYNQINNRVSEILSFIEIGFSVGIISEMNSSILSKEFNELKKSIMEIAPKKENNWLEEFISESPLLMEEGAGGGNSKITTSPFGHSSSIRRRENSIGQGTRIGVQKGSTLMKALSDRIPGLNKRTLSPDVKSGSRHEVVGNKRREEIILIIKDKMKSPLNFNGLTITDIKSQGQGVLASCGEKTLQRELVSMVLAGILKKTGEKRWSRYSLAF